MRDNHETSSLLLLSLALLLGACSSGSGSSSGGGGNAGGDVYSQADFDYQDPNPVAFQPLGLDSSVLTRRDELMILNVPEDPENARGTLFDDIQAGAGVLGELEAFSGAGQFRASAAGNMDDDGEPELLVARIVGSSIEILQVEPTGSGYAQTDSFSISSAGFTYREVRLSVGDVDGDHRDELFLVASSSPIGDSSLASDFWIRVYDDAQDGWQLLFEEEWSFLYPSQNIRDIQLVAAHLDDDGETEIAMLLLSGTPSSGSTHLRLFDSASSNFAQLQGFTAVETNLTGDSGGRLHAAQLDEDRLDELVVASYLAQGGFGGSSAATFIQAFDYDGSALVGSPEKTLTSMPGGFGFINSHRAFDAVPFDRDGDGIDELAVLMPGDLSSAGDRARLRVLAWDGAGFIDDIEVEMTELQGDDAASLVATDDEADGQDELYYCSISGSSSSSSKSRLVRRIDWGAAGNPITDTWTAQVPASGGSYPPVLVAADFDADGMTVRYTGNKFTLLSDPMPLIVLVAAPTKAGISQNYNGTSTGYSVSSGVAESYGVTTGITASVYSGFEVSDLFDVLGASARQTVSGAFLTSQTKSTKETVVQGFVGSYDTDTIVFQGNLYQSYEYEVLASVDPNLVGTFFTIDVPVQSKIYKWTVDYYNSQVEAGLQIGVDVLTHTIGDPTSYLSRTEVQGLVDDFVGWKTPDSPAVTVGQTQASNTQKIELEQETTSGTQRTIDVTWEVGFKIGGSQFGGSFGLTNSSAYSVSVSNKTVYDGVIGDISLQEDWQNWHYEFGLGVYHRGLYSDSNNEPTSQQEGVLPYQVLTFWTNPTGANY